MATILLAVGAPVPVTAFVTNSFRFENMPVRWWYNPANEPPPPPGTSWEELITLAAQNWADVACADVSFEYEGTSDAEWADDGDNVIYWMSPWGFGSSAAGATLHIPQSDGEAREVDLALNGENYSWTVGGGDAFQTSVVDAESVLTHELGHWLGLSHSPDQFATMYLAKLIGTMQASLDSDDKFGVCSLYPSGQNECSEDTDCPQGWECRGYEGLRVCGERRDPVGSHCSKDYLNCEDMCFITFFDCSGICAFTETDYSDGYCARLCLNEGGDEYECQPGYTCQEVPGQAIKACLRPPEEPDAVEVVEGAEAVEMAEAVEAPEPGADGATEQVEPLPADAGAGNPGTMPESGCSSSERPLTWAWALLLLLILRARARARARG